VFVQLKDKTFMNKAVKTTRPRHNQITSWHSSITMEIGKYLVSLLGKHQFVDHWKCGWVKDSCFRKLSETIGVDCYVQVSDTCTTPMSIWSEFLIFVVGTKSENWVPVPTLNLLAESSTPIC